jgi:hypothetical protein
VPTATLLFAVVLALRASLPRATLLLPVVLTPKASFPIALLKLPVVLASSAFATYGCVLTTCGVA